MKTIAKKLTRKKSWFFIKNNSSYVYDTLKKCAQQEKIPREKILFYSQNDKADKKGRRFRVIG